MLDCPIFLQHKKIGSDINHSCLRPMQVLWKGLIFNFLLPFNTWLQDHNLRKFIS